MKVIIEARKIGDKTMTVAVFLDVKTHVKLEKIIKNARRRGLKIGKQKICKMIIEANVSEVRIR